MSYIYRQKHLIVILLFKIKCIHQIEHCFYVCQWFCARLNFIYIYIYRFWILISRLVFLPHNMSWWFDILFQHKWISSTINTSENNTMTAYTLTFVWYYLLCSFTSSFDYYYFQVLQQCICQRFNGHHHDEINSMSVVTRDLMLVSLYVSVGCPILHNNIDCSC